MNLGRYLKQKRERAGLTQWEVCDQLGYSTAQFCSNWERSVSRPPDESLPILAKLYKVPLRELVEAIAEEKRAEVESWKKEAMRLGRAG